MVCSIIIATCNRARDLDQTLRRLDEISIPSGWDVELIVADNASTDDTAAVARAAQLKNIEVRYVYEGRKGKSHALNSALAAARGQVLLFTDDDVRPPKNWLELMGKPLLDRECDGTVGNLELAPELLRPWMTENYWGGIAKYDGSGNAPLFMVGANMGIHRSVLERVPAFDVEVGPGALGFFDDTLFGWQLAEAGFRLRFIPEAAVVHHADASRLLRRHCLSERVKYGASSAYVLYHWRHETLNSPLLRYYYVSLKLAVRRIVQPPQPLDAEGMPPWEVSYVADIAMNRQFLIERRRPRNYSKLGLIKRRQS